jgi:DNA-binding protein H-NS
MAVSTKQAGQEESIGAEEAQLTPEDISTITEMFEIYPIPKLRAVITYVEGMIEDKEASEREERERAESEEREARAAEIEAIRHKIGEFGLTAPDLFPEILGQKSPQKSRKRKSSQNNYQKSHRSNPAFAVRYRGPNGETWSGRGMAPRWIRDEEAAGGTREKFAVTEG